MVARAAVAAILLASGAGRAADAPALPPGVIVVRPPADDRLLDEASWRVRSELDAAGVSSRMVECSPVAAGCGRDDASVARIVLSREDGIVNITVAATLPDGLELRRRVRVAEDQGGAEPEVIAIRAVELLRDIYLDIPRASRPPPARQPRPAPAAVPTPIPSERPGGQVFGGVGVLTGRKGLGPAVAPYAGVGIGLGRFLIVATIAGPFSRRLVRRVPSSIEPAGEADVNQNLLTLGLRYEIAAWRVRPFATVVTGLHYVGVRGVSGYDAPAPSASALAPMLGAGAGVSVPIWKWLLFTTEMAVLASNPSIDVTIQGDVIGRAGAPSFFARAGLAIAP